MAMEKPQMHIENIEKSKYQFFSLTNSRWIEYFKTWNYDLQRKPLVL